ILDSSGTALIGSPPSTTLGTRVKDKANVTTTVNNIPSSSTVTFTLYDNATCNGNVISTEPSIAVSGAGTSLTGSATSILSPVLGAGSYSYKADFVSGNTTASGAPNASGACEPLAVPKAQGILVDTKVHDSAENVVTDVNGFAHVAVGTTV